MSRVVDMAERPYTIWVRGHATLTVDQPLKRFPIPHGTRNVCAACDPFFGLPNAYPRSFSYLHRTGGDILIKYHDDAVYDGPYVPELCLDSRGRVPFGEPQC